MVQSYGGRQWQVKKLRMGADLRSEKFLLHYKIWEKAALRGKYYLHKNNYFISLKRDAPPVALLQVLSFYHHQGAIWEFFLVRIEGSKDKGSYIFYKFTGLDLIWIFDRKQYIKCDQKIKPSWRAFGTSACVALLMLILFLKLRGHSVFVQDFTL